MCMQERIKNTVASVLLVLSAALVGGWGEDGHRIVGDIAGHELTPAAAAAIGDLLEGKSLADISNWADEIRSDPNYKWAAVLHYVNIDPAVKSFDYRRDCPTGTCVVGAIYRYTGVLRDPGSTRAQKVEALKFLVHFVEDVHQPLHVSPAGDRGGNDVKVEFFGHPANLHEVWDSLIIQHADQPWRAYAAGLRRGITDEERRAWQQLDAADWATESYQLAVSHAHVIPADHRLGEAYQARNLPVVEKRLRMGGIRLAAMLNAIFGDGRGLPEPPRVTTAPSSEPATRPASEPASARTEPRQ